MDDRNRPNLGLPLLGLGIAVGWLLRRMLQQQYEEQNPRGSEMPSDREMLQEVFGHYSSQAQEYVDEVRENIEDQVEQLQLPWEDIDFRKYGELVKNAVNELQDDGSISNAQARRLSQYLMKDFRLMRRNTQRMKGQARGRARSAREAAESTTQRVTRRAKSVTKKA